MVKKKPKGKLFTENANRIAGVAGWHNLTFICL